MSKNIEYLPFKKFQNGIIYKYKTTHLQKPNLLNIKFKLLLQYK